MEAGGGRSLEWCSWLVNVCVHFIVVGYSLSQTSFGTAWSRRRETGEPWNSKRIGLCGFLGTDR